MAKRILLIDNQRDWLMFAESVLKGAGFDVKTAVDTKEAWSLLSAAHNDLSLILVDLGSVQEDTVTFQAISRTQSGHKRPIVVLFSTEMTPTGMSRVFRLGAYDCENKQYSSQGLLDLVEEALADYQPPPEGSPHSSERGMAKKKNQACSPDPSFAQNTATSNPFSLCWRSC